MTTVPYLPREPRRYSPTAGRPPELGSRPVPVRPPATPAAANAKRPARFGIGRISIVRHGVDPARVFEQLFGKELKVDEHTGVCNLGPGRAVVPPGPERA